MRAVFAIAGLLFFVFLSPAACGDIEVKTDVESGNIVEEVTWLRPQKRVHLLLKKDIPNHWFLFSLKGVKDKTLTIEVQGQTTMHSFDAWQEVRPFVADTGDISDPLLYDEAAYQKRHGKLPWRRLTDARYDREFRTMFITQTFTSNEATIALKYPCPVSYVESYLSELSKRLPPEVLGLYQTGQPQGEPPLRVVTVPRMEGANAQRWKEKPTVLMYGGEHATEHESSQVILGAVEWLTGNDPQAQKYRNDYNVILIPHLFPYETTISRFNLVTEGFVPSPRYATSKENELWAKFFNTYIDEGHFVDVALSIHNTAGSETGNFYCAMVQQFSLDGSDRKFTEPLNAAILSSVKESSRRAANKPGIGKQPSSWTVEDKRPDAGNWAMRLAGWLGTSFSSNALFYEINGQNPKTPLSLTQVRSAGAFLLQGVRTYFASDLFAAQREREKQRFLLRQKTQGGNVPSPGILRSQRRYAFMVDVQHV